MLDAYLDESGIHDNAPICVIAGYYAGQGQWRRFKIDWSEVLDGHKVPLDKFHAKDLVKRSGFFASLSRSDHARLLEEVGDCICRHKLYPVGQAIVVEDFNLFTDQQKRFFTGAVLDDGKLKTFGCPGKPYFMPFQNCVKQIAKAAATTKVNFYFGLDRPFGGYATMLLGELKESTHVYHEWGKHIGLASFPFAAETPQLQAADFLSYLLYRDMAERKKSNTLHPRGPASGVIGKCLARAVPTDVVYADRDTLEDLLQQSYRDQGHWEK